MNNKILINQLKSINKSIKYNKYSIKSKQLTKQDILFIDNHLVVVNKPNNINSHKDINDNEDSLVDKVKYYIKSINNKSNDVYLSLVHRLDKTTSGVMIYARTSKAASRLSLQFSNRLIDKKYLAIVDGKIDGYHEYNHILRKDNGLTTVFEYNPSLNYSYSSDLSLAKLSFYSLLSFVSNNNKYNESNDIKQMKYQLDKNINTTSINNINEVTNNIQSLLLVSLHTGRKHQIRAQLSHIGHPIVGDKRYNAKQTYGSQDIALHAYSIIFNHPISQERMIFTAQPPNNWLNRFGSDVLDKINQINLTIKHL